MSNVSLSQKMRQYAKTVDEVTAKELEMHASELDKAIEGFYGTPQTVPVAKFVGTWAKARKYWCNLTGEDLI